MGTAEGGGAMTVFLVSTPTVCLGMVAAAEGSSRDLLCDVILGVITGLSRDLWALQNPFDKSLFILN